MSADTSWPVSRQHRFSLNVATFTLSLYALILGSALWPACGRAVTNTYYAHQQQALAAKMAGHIESRFKEFQTTLTNLSKIAASWSAAKTTYQRQMPFYWDAMRAVGTGAFVALDANGNVLFFDHQKGWDPNIAVQFVDLDRISESIPRDQRVVVRKLTPLPNARRQRHIAAVVRVPAKGSAKKSVVLMGIFDLPRQALELADMAAGTDQAGVLILDRSSRMLGHAHHSGYDQWDPVGPENFPFSEQLLTDMHSGRPGVGEFAQSPPLDLVEYPETAPKRKYFLSHVPFQLGSVDLTLAIWRPRDSIPPTPAVKSSWPYSQYAGGILLAAIMIAGIVLLHRYKLLTAQSEKNQRHQQRLLTILDSIDAAVYVVDVNRDQVLYANEFTQQLYGSVIGKPCHDAFGHLAASSCDPCRPINDETCSTADGANEPQVYRDPNNARWFQAQSQMIQWIDGRDVRLEIATDITQRKRAEGQLDQAYQQTTTFCRVIRHMGALRTLEEMGDYLMAELVAILNNPHMVLFVFSADRRTLFRIRAGSVNRYETPEIVQHAKACLAHTDQMAIGTSRPFRPPLLPESMHLQGKQTVMRFKNPPYFHGALVVLCSGDKACDTHQLKLVQVVLEQAAGNITRIVAQEHETQMVIDRLNQHAAYSGIIGRDPKMQVIYKLIADTAPSTASVLIQGESGTGKELVARAIHRQSPRRDKPFVVINCAAYSATLLESELFGHEKGAFSGATRQKPGRFEMADGGTVLLDEIGEISPAAQLKLLRVLQTQKFERVGGERTLVVDVRILAATNRNLIDEVKAGRFREDLYYRLNVIPIHLPPLRERPGDIALLTHHFIKQFSGEGTQDVPEVSPQAMRHLIAYPWAGNVRELENSVEHAFVLAKGQKIEASHLPEAILANHPLDLGRSTGSMVETEKRLLEDTLMKCRWNKSKAARQLGISRSTLYYKIKRYQLKRYPNGQSAT